MNINKFSIIATGFSILLGSPVLNAQVPPNAQQWNANEHYYELVVPSGTVSWSDAVSAASERSFVREDNVEYRAYLATLTSAAENQFVFTEVAQASPQIAWLGGYQLPDANQSDRGWRWINNNGEIPGTNPSMGSEPYANWESGEPRNSALGGSEENVFFGVDERDYLAFDSSTAQWHASTLNGVTSLPSARVVTAYVVEYEPIPQTPIEEVGVITDPGSCKEDHGDGSGCTTIPEHRIILPASAEIPEGATIVYRAWYFEDPRVTDKETAHCDVRESMDVFSTLLPAETDLHGTLILQEYLCGSPRFGVVRTYAPEITIATDTVKTVHEKLDGNLFECDPTGHDPADVAYEDASAGIDNPQFRDVAVWKSTRHSMLEEGYDNEYVGHIGESWEGSASERTNDCGTSEADTEEKSYFALGLHIDFGPGYYEPENTFDKFVLLTYYKMLMLRDNVDIANDDIDDDSDVKKLRKEVKKATEELLDGDYDESLEKIEKFLSRLDETEFNEEYTLFNRYGELKSRGLNIAYTLREKIIPFAP